MASLYRQGGTAEAGEGYTVEDLPQAPEGFLAAEPVEGYAFYRAFEAAQVEGFTLGYLRLSRNGTTVATVPYFTTRYAINTTLKPGLLKTLLSPFWFNIVSVGHPVADFGHIDGDASPPVLAAINKALARKAPIVAYKDFPAGMTIPGFSCEPDLPVAVLDVPQDYYARLKQHVRSDFRRRMRKAAALRIEEHDGFPAFVAERIYELYLNVYNNGEFAFEKLTPKFFEACGPISKYMLYWEGDVLIGFSLLLCKKPLMHYKYLGMDYARGRPHGLYFIMSLSHIDVCLRDGYTTYQTGPTAYPFKQRLGSRLVPVYLYFRHRNPVLNWIIRCYMALAGFKPATDPAGTDAPPT
jgi:hypothetical protein